MFIPVADTLTAVEFNHDGTMLATGDRGGRVVVFKKKTDIHNNSKVGGTSTPSSPHSPHRNFTPRANDNEWSVHYQFKSHDQEFDYLKSLEIEEKINKIRWLKHSCMSSSASLLTTNGTTLLTNNTSANSCHNHSPIERL